MDQFPAKLLNGIPDAFLILDATGIVLFGNQAATDLFGKNMVGKAIGLPLEDFSTVKVMGLSAIHDAELRVANTSEFREGSYGVVLRDVTERERLKVNLQTRVDALQRLTDLLLVIPCPVVRADRFGHIEWKNKSFVESYGELTNLADIPVLASSGQKLAELLKNEPGAPALKELVFDTGLNETPPLLVQSVLLSKYVTDLPGKDQFAIVLNATLESEALLKSYMNSMYFDQDLGIANRRGLILQSSNDWQNSGLEQSCATIAFFGSDLVEQEIIAVRNADLVKARWHAILTEHGFQSALHSPLTLRLGRVAPNALALVISVDRDYIAGADRIQDALIAQIFDRATDKIHIGVVSDTRAAPNLEDAIEESLIAAQEAFDRNQPKHRFDADYGQILAERKQLTEGVRQAIIDKSFTVALQPRLNLNRDRVETAEILARLNLPTLGEITPAVFIPILRRLNLMSELTQIISRRALEIVSSWKQQQLHEISLSINISPVDISNHRALSIIRSLSKEFSSQNQLELEISEMDPLPQESHPGLKALLANMGIELSIDDFGKGYSSISYLVSLPISVIKIDKSFADDLLVSERKKNAATLYRSIVALSKELEISVCAEGIETQEQLDLMRAIGIDQIQGFVFSKPLSPNDFAAKFLVPNE